MALNWKTSTGIVVALILGGCVTDERNVSANPTPAAPPPADKPVVAQPVVEAKSLSAAPAAVFSKLDGQNISLSKLRGKVVYIDFWATWCGPCVAGLPFTQRLSAAFKDKGLVVLAVSNETAPTVKAFMAQSGYTFSAVLDTKNFAEKFGVNGIPHTVVIDRQGRIVAEEEGLGPQAETIRNLAKAGLDVGNFEPLQDPTLDRLLG